MLLITLREWAGPSRDTDLVIEVQERTVAMATELPLGEALRRIKVYESLYVEAGHAMVIEHRLLSVSVIEPLDAELAWEFEVNMVEHLAQTQEERH